MAIGSAQPVDDWNDISTDWREQPASRYNLPGPLQKRATDALGYRHGLNKLRYLQEEAASDQTRHPVLPAVQKPLKVAPGERVRGSASIGLNANGIAQSEANGRHYLRRGGIDGIITSTLPRSLQTATAISRTSKAPVLDATPDIGTQHLGHLEGKPLTEALPEIIKLQNQTPNVAPKGKGEMSTEPGESFNAYKQRVLPYMKAQLAEHKANPKLKRVLIGNHTLIKTMEA